MVHAATASGKSRILLDNLQPEIGGKLLVVTPTTVDVVGMHPSTKVKSSFRIGLNMEGGASPDGTPVMGSAI